ncbi:MAG: uroporphyrinogen-III C-methyltransferase [Sulfuricellaceae bacterium]|nr:uroporphyrinogen-III C-methyltransferase [Sulfuricellaceae bacterium]
MADTPDTLNAPQATLNTPEPPLGVASQATSQTVVATGYLSLGLVVALMALISVGWLWVDTRQREAAMDVNLSKRLEGFDVRGKESAAQAKQSQEALREAQARLELLEQKLAESQTRQVALAEMYQEMARNRDEWALADIEQILLVASQQLQLAGNARAALAALQMADGRLQRMDKPQFFALRKAIIKDIEQLQALPMVDMAGLNLRLENLALEVDEWVLLPGRAEPQKKVAEKTASGAAASDAWWQRLGQEVWRDVRQMVRIQNMEKPMLPLLAPEQAYFLRENLKLRLLSARLALLQHNEESFKADIQAAEKWLSRYFDPRDPATQKAQTRLKQLAQSRLTIEMPDISASLGAVQSFKLSREKIRP